MGTNYYLSIPIDKENVKKQTNILIDEEKLDELCDYIDNVKTNHYINSVLCSYGWKFLFNAHKEKYYPLTRQGIIDYITARNAIIKDEYNRDISLKDFWDMIDKHQNGHDMKTYANEKNEYYAHSFDYYNKDYAKYKPNQFGEFISDGLRFATYTDFC